MAPTDVAAGLPAILDLRWTVAALSAPVPAVEGVLAVATAAATTAAQSGPAVPGAGPGVAGPGGLLSAFVDGLLLALAPPCLALLLLFALAPQERPHRQLGELAQAWPQLVGVFASLLLLLAGLGSLARAQGRPPLDGPALVALLALPSLALALLLWLRHGEAPPLGSSAGSELAAALATPVLALPWIPLSPAAAAVAAGVGGVGEAAATAAGFALPFVLAELAAAALAALRLTPWRPVLGLALGFLPVLTLVWVSYRLGQEVPSHRIALLQLSWLGVALLVRLTSGTRHRGGRAVAAIAALGAAAAGVAILV